MNDTIEILDKEGYFNLRKQRNALRDEYESANSARGMVGQIKRMDKVLELHERNNPGHEREFTNSVK